MRRSELGKRLVQNEAEQYKIWALTQIIRVRKLAVSTKTKAKAYNICWMCYSRWESSKDPLGSFWWRSWLRSSTQNSILSSVVFKKFQKFVSKSGFFLDFTSYAFKNLLCLVYILKLFKISGKLVYVFRQSDYPSVPCVLPNLCIPLCYRWTLIGKLSG